ncbi:MAG: PAS domain S-box protein, partial [Deltaproteobacteria bacterium]|nr:PAS domain S-box protein [Deltaproteobacteria bacterium]
MSVGIFFEVVRTFRFPVPERYVTELKTRDNAVIPVELNHIKFSGDDDTGMGCLVMLTDLRDRQTLQEEAQRISIEKDALAMQLAGRAPDADLVERSHLEQEIQSEKAFLENVIESCGDGIIILDGQGVITRANDAFTRIVGKSKSELVSSTLFDLGPAEGAFRSTTGETVTLDQVYRDYTYRQVEKFVALGSGGHVENWEYYVFNSRGEIVPLDATATMQKNALGVITGSVCVLRDVTERKKAERDLQEAYQFRSQFFANITHEFRTPLTLAIGPIEDILRGGFGDVGRPVADQLGVALRNSRRLLKLINQLLDFSMLESGAQNLVCETRDLKAFAAAILDSFSLIARKRKINLAFQPAADLPPVSIDP